MLLPTLQVSAWLTSRAKRRSLRTACRESARRPRLELLEDRVVPTLAYPDWVAVSVAHARTLDEAQANTIWPGAAIKYDILVPKPAASDSDSATYHVQMSYGPFNASNAAQPVAGRPTLAATTMGQLDPDSGMLKIDISVGKNTVADWSIEATAPTIVASGQSSFTNTLTVDVAALSLKDSAAATTMLEPNFLISQTDPTNGQHPGVPGYDPPWNLPGLSYKVVITGNSTVPHTATFTDLLPAGTARAVFTWYSSTGTVLEQSNVTTPVYTRSIALAKDEALIFDFSMYPAEWDESQGFPKDFTNKVSMVTTSPADNLPAAPDSYLTETATSQQAEQFQLGMIYGVTVPGARNVDEIQATTLWPGADYSFQVNYPRVGSSDNGDQQSHTEAVVVVGPFNGGSHPEWPTLISSSLGTFSSGSGYLAASLSQPSGVFEIHLRAPTFMPEGISSYTITVTITTTTTTTTGSDVHVWESTTSGSKTTSLEKDFQGGQWNVSYQPDGVTAPGQDLLYWAFFTPNKAGSQSGIFTDALPAGANGPYSVEERLFASWPPADWRDGTFVDQFSVLGGSFSRPFKDLLPGQTLVFAISMAAAPMPAGKFTNIFEVAPLVSDGLEASSFFTNAIADHDLRVTVEPVNTVGAAGGEVTYPVHIWNTGPTETLVQINDEVSDGMIIDVVDVTDPRYGFTSPMSRTFTGYLTLPPGETILNVIAQSPNTPAGTIQNTVSVFDPNHPSDATPSDNYNIESDITTLVPGANAYLVAEAAPLVVGVGDVVTYTFHVGNLGPEQYAPKVYLTDILPTGVVLDAANSSSGWTQTAGKPGELSYYVGDVPYTPDPHNAYKTITLAVKATQPGEFHNFGQVSSIMPDPNMHNNRSGAEFIAVAPTTFGISSPKEVKNGEKFSITITALDQTGAVYSKYKGTVNLTVATSQGTKVLELPGISFPAGNQGVLTLQDLSVSYPGAFILTVQDATISSLEGHAPLKVQLFVTTTADSGIGSLRAAIVAADKVLDPSAGALPNIMHFAISGSGVHTISPLSPLPTITQAVLVDATTQSGYAGSPLIELSGASAGAATSGFTIAAANTTIKGLAINRFGANGILITGPGSDKVMANYIGADPSGTRALPNLGSGVMIDNSPDNVIGGARMQGQSLDAGNLLSGNGPAAGQWPTPVGVESSGVFIRGPGAVHNVVASNTIGLSKGRDQGLGNGRNGVFVTGGASNNSIGGLDQDDGAGNTLLSGNWIASNRNDGVLVGSDPLVGYSTPAGTGNAILSNFIYANGKLDVDLGPDDGPTENTSGPHDSGPNLLQNYPQLSVPSFTKDATTVTFTLDGKPNTDITIQIFAQAAPDSLGVGGSCRLVATQTVTTDADGFAQETATFAKIKANEYLTATATDAANNTSELARPRNPVFLVPGIAGSFATPPAWQDWKTRRGLPPSELEIDPLQHYYDDIIVTLTNAGYTLNQDLFVVTYDWRLPPGPTDGAIDGVINGVAPFSGTYRYAVDYFTDALEHLVSAWQGSYPGLAVPPVDVITHSTGGLITRTYVQSALYGAAFTAGGKQYNLPKIDNFVMIGVPNQGASKPWNMLHDDWGADFAYARVLAKIVFDSYKELVTNATKITGPDYTITIGSIRDPDPIKQEANFIRLYCPTLQALLATYPFMISSSGLIVPDELKNSLVLDLNGNQQNRNYFADDGRVQHVVDFYSTSKDTLTWVRQQVGEGGYIWPISQTQWSINGVPTVANQVWYRDVFKYSGAGDGTVPTVSSAGLFFGDSNVQLENIPGASHTGLVSDPTTQSKIMKLLGTPLPKWKIKTGLADKPGEGLITIVMDPVEGFIVDGQGRRLGYSDATGPLTEIPGSFYYGDENGVGWLTEPVDGSLHLELTGQGGSYNVLVEGGQGNQMVGLTASGSLAQGERKLVDVPFYGPGPVSTLVAMGPGIAGSGAISTILVDAVDAGGNVNPGYTGTVHFTSTDGSALLPADYTFTAEDAGVHAFQVNLKSLGNQKVTVADTAGTLTTDTQVTIVGPATHFRIDASPSIFPGVPASFVVRALDSLGNQAVGYTGTVHLSSTDGTALLPPNFTFPAEAQGQAVLPVTLEKTGSQTVTVRDVNSLSIQGQITTAVTSRTYVKAVYQDVLGRQPDEGGLNYWTAQIDSGAPRQPLIHLIDHSEEYFETIINPAYAQFLGRQPDSGGLAYWVSRMQQGLTDEQLEAGFIGSPEYYQHSGGTDKSWVDAMYTNLLGRLPDPGGEAYWVNQLAHGASREAVSYGFAASTEREKQRIGADYQKYLGRQADPGGLAYWLDQFVNHGQTNEDVITGFVASDEYFMTHWM